MRHEYFEIVDWNLSHAHVRHIHYGAPVLNFALNHHAVANEIEEVRRNIRNELKVCPLINELPHSHHNNWLLRLCPSAKINCTRLQKRDIFRVFIFNKRISYLLVLKYSFISFLINPSSTLQESIAHLGLFIHIVVRQWIQLILLDVLHESLPSFYFSFF